MVKMGLENLTNGVQVIAIVCNQFGDTGKGKFSDYFASNWADVIARGTGGANAGHTVSINGEKRVFHLVPAGIAYDSMGKTNILGNGMVIDPAALVSEMNDLQREGVTFNNFMVSDKANVILPYHINFDVAKNKSQKNGGIGSTGRGIGPAYTDKIARRGITMADLLDKDSLARKVKNAANFYDIANQGEIVDFVYQYSEKLEPFVRDTVSEMHQMFRQGKKILIEGAQGLFLSIEHGLSPYVTSSDCSLNGTASGVGLSASAIDLPLGIVKFPFMTRVGGGPFPTEIGGKESREYCAQDSGNTKIAELERFNINYQMKDGNVIYNPQDDKILSLIRNSDELIKGIGIRLAANEFGATTGRPRRVGWTDLNMLRYATAINGSNVVLTKVDSFADAGDFKLAFDYSFAGNNHAAYHNDSEFMERATPNLKRYAGYSDIREINEFDSLDAHLGGAIKDLEHFADCKVVAVSVGEDQQQTIFRH